MRALNREGTTVFLTTQYMEEADQLAARIAIIDNGLIVAEGTPASLKARVGDPTLQVALVPGGDEPAAEAVLQRFGESVPAPNGSVASRLPGGAEQVTEAVRALDEAGIKVAGLELHNPTLDDVFQQVTGRRLEGAATGAAAGAAVGDEAEVTA